MYINVQYIVNNHDVGAVIRQRKVHGSLMQHGIIQLLIFYTKLTRVKRN